MSSNRRIALRIAMPAVALALAGSFGFTGAVPATAANATTEQQVRAAFTDLAVDEIDLRADVELTCAGGGALERTGGNGIVIHGHGHTISQTCSNARVISVDGPGGLQLEDLTVQGGSLVTGDGGGIRSTGNNTSILINSHVIANQTVEGDGGGVSGYEIVLRNSTVGDNHASGDGGGVRAFSLVVVESTLRGNTAGGVGGGADASTAGLFNTTVSDNVASASGGGINVNDGEITYSTVVGNSAAVASNVQAAQGLNSFGSVLANPLGGANCGGTFVPAAHGYSYSDDASCGFSGSTDRQSAGDPMLGALADNGGDTETRLPQPGSPLLNAVPLDACQNDGASGITADQRGVDRPQGTGCDIGSVELAVAAPPTTGTTAKPDAVSSPKFTG